MGVIYNNRVAALTTMAIFETSDSLVKDSLLILAKKDALTAINIYNNWTKEFGTLTEAQIRAKVEPIYNAQNIAFNTDQKKQYIVKRIRDIELAQKETPRRLSVSYTNLGIILRHQGSYEKAIMNYQKALDLWSNNLAAENNINILLGRPIKERSVLEKIFPENK